MSKLSMKRAKSIILSGKSRLSIGILRVSEMRRTVNVLSGTISYTFQDIPMVNISERLLLIPLNNIPIKFKIIRVYAPTADADEIIETFYSDLTNTLRSLSKHDLP